MTLAYCLGLGVPFIIVAVAFRRALSVLTIVKRHYASVTRIGGLLLVTVGIMLVTGLWADLVGHLQSAVHGYVPAI